MRRIALTVLLALAWAVPSPAAPESPATRPARAIEARRLCTRSIGRALDGQFRQAHELAVKAHRAAPDDAFATRLEGLLEDYLEARKRADQQRREEYADAVERVRRGMLAQEHVASLEEQGVAEPIREALAQAFSSYSKSAEAIDAVDRALRETFAAEGDAAAAPRAQAEAKRDEAVAQLEVVGEQLVKARELLGDHADGEYATWFVDLCEQAEGQLQRQVAAWRKLPVEKGLWRWTERLRELDDDLAQSLADVDAMVEEKPWRTALVQAALARRLAEDIDVAETDWYPRIVRDMEARARRAEEDARWYDALSAHSGLKELDPDNESYERKVDLVRRHVRVLGLYGAEEDEDEAATRAVEEPPAWRETVSGVDAEMVKSAVSRLDTYYVTRVDYREVARAALQSVRVLAETPQVAGTFAGLSDEDKRERFCKAVDRQIDNIEARDRVDHVDVLLAFNAVLRASEQSVRIPAEVLAVEFTDGLLSALDKFTGMIWPSELSDFVKNTMGHFTGVGIQITKEPGEPLRVVTPLADSPALEAGIRSGDKIVAVDGTSARDLSINKLVGMIMGEEGTKVVLTIERCGQPAPFDVPVIRDRIDIRTVKGWRRLRGGQWQYLLDPADGVGYIRLEQFTEQTPQELRAAMADLRGQLEAREMTLRSLVLDLRFNPGGLLPSARAVANEFLNHGRIVSTR
ncbi:MAG: S41 family peptidase, partial [Planctomycetota bacterium]